MRAVIISMSDLVLAVMEVTTGASPGVKNVLPSLWLKIWSYSMPALQFGAKPYSQPTPTVPPQRVRSAEANPMPVAVSNKSHRWLATAGTAFDITQGGIPGVANLTREETQCIDFGSPGIRGK